MPNDTTPYSQKFAQQVAVAACPALAWTVIGLPFDVVRARLQTTSMSRFRGPTDVVKAMLRREGIGALWKGFWPAFLKELPFATVLFGMYNFFKPDSRQYCGQGGARWNYYAGVFAAGASSGVPLTLLANPLDVWRIRVQTAGIVGIKDEIGTRSAAETPGGVLRQLQDRKHLLMRGASMQLVKNIFGSGLYFVFNEAMLRESFTCQGAVSPVEERGCGHPLASASVPSQDVESSAVVARTSVGSFRRLFAGGLTGLLFSFIFHPTEVIKARMMVSETQGVLDIVRPLYQDMGIRGLYRGASVACWKAFPTHAAGFWAMHLAERATGGEG